MMRTRSLFLPVLLLLAACAWTRRENRPVWSAFEANLVPESPALFTATLPATVVLGTGAILVDTLVAHPLQVVDEAWDDSAGLWRNLDLEQAYYTEAAFMPFRAVATPIVFVGSFLGRSMFDFRAREEVDAERAPRAASEHRATKRWLEDIAAGFDGRLSTAAPEDFDAELRGLLAAALEKGTALGRRRVYETAASSFADLVDWHAALQDPSAVVRFRVLEVLPRDVPLTPELQERLRADPDEAVRLLAARVARR
jgi:hypothetical protein